MYRLLLASEIIKKSDKIMRRPSEFFVAKDGQWHTRRNEKQKPFAWVNAKLTEVGLEAGVIQKAVRRVCHESEITELLSYTFCSNQDSITKPKIYNLDLIICDNLNRYWQVVAEFKVMGELTNDLLNSLFKLKYIKRVELLKL